MGEEEATKTQARKAKKQQDQSGTDQRWVVGQAEMQVVPLAWQLPMGSRGV